MERGAAADVGSVALDDISVDGVAPSRTKVRGEPYVVFDRDCGAHFTLHLYRRIST